MNLSLRIFLMCVIPCFAAAPERKPEDYPSLTQKRTYSAGFSLRAISFSHDGKLLALAGRDSQGAGPVRLWDMSMAKEVKTLEGHGSTVNSIAFSPDDKMLATGSSDNSVIIWDKVSGKEVMTLKHPERVECVEFSPDGKILASACQDGLIRLWNMDSFKEIQVLKHSDGNKSVVALAISWDSKTLASSGFDNKIVLWDLDKGKRRCTLTGHAKDVRAMAFDKDNEYLASASGDNTIRLWRVDTGKEDAVLDGHKNGAWCVVFSKKGHWLISAGSLLKDNEGKGEIKVWNTKTHKAVLTLESHSLPTIAMALSNDNKTLCAADVKGEMLFWDVDFGE